MISRMQFKLHPATDGFPDALARSNVKRSDWQAYFCNSREPAYTNIFTRFLPPVTSNKLRVLKMRRYLLARTGGSCARGEMVMNRFKIQKF